VRKAKSFGSRVSVLEEDMTHGEIDARLGLHSAYTEVVEECMRSLGPTVAQRLDSMAAQVAALPVVISR
jgi:tartrate dehydratase beta subunit/fumarate hydratase class I family protein